MTRVMGLQRMMMVMCKGLKVVGQTRQSTDAKSRCGTNWPIIMKIKKIEPLAGASQCNLL